MPSLFLLRLPGPALRTMLPVLLEAVEQLPVAGVLCRRLIDHHDVEPCKQRRMLSKRLADDAFDPVPLCRGPAMFFCYRQPEPACFEFVLPAQHRKPFVPAARRFFKHPPVGRHIEQALVFTKVIRRAASQECWWVSGRRQNRLRRQFDAALCTTARKHETAAFRCHAGAKPVRACALQSAWLKSAFHCSLPVGRQAVLARFWKGGKGTEMRNCCQ